MTAEDKEKYPGGCGARNGKLGIGQKARVMTNTGKVYDLTENTRDQALAALALLPGYDEPLFVDDNEVTWILASQIIYLY